MAQIIGQIESLKRLKQELSQNGVTRFNSIGEINKFLTNYESELQGILLKEELNLNNEIDELRSQLSDFQNHYKKAKREATEDLNSQILLLNERITTLKSSNSHYLPFKLLNWIKLKISELKRTNLEHNFSKIIQRHTSFAEQKVNETRKKVDALTLNRKSVLSKRCQPYLEQISNTKKVVDELNPLIAGAIGENAVVKELETLSDEFILINDYSVTFNTPIFNRKNNDRIFSIQIDHLLITKAGVFILETKNWSRKSIMSFDLRSPIEQIKRASYALFVMLNSNSEQNHINLSNHHWGSKQIPIRNVVVMINEKPKEKFKYVSIKSLNELKNYITYFESIFSSSEVEGISEYLIKMKE